MIQTPLVSIVIITYNSAKYVLETLESAKNQTYQNLELIITDDGSTDETVNLCKNWILKNTKRFYFSEVLTAQQNYGVSLNVKKGVEVANGQWIKLIAGDDILLDNCIENFIDVSYTISFDWAISLMKKNKNETIIEAESENIKLNYFFNLSDEDKYKYYLLNPIFLNPPTGFYRASVIKQSGIIDGSFKLLEDQPIFLNLLKNRYKGYFFKVPTVIYRINTSSISGKVNKDFYKNLFACYKKYRKSEMPDSFIGNIYSKSLEMRFQWLTSTYTAKNKFQIFESICWEKFNDLLAKILINRI